MVFAPEEYEVSFISHKAFQYRKRGQGPLILFMHQFYCW